VDIAAHPLNVCFISKSMVQHGRDVRFVPKADIMVPLFDHLVGATEQRQGHRKAERALAAFILMISSIFVDCITGRLAGLSPLRMRPV
jgi:hypothetical protein